MYGTQFVFKTRNKFRGQAGTKNAALLVKFTVRDKFRGQVGTKNAALLVKFTVRDKFRGQVGTKNAALLVKFINAHDKFRAKLVPKMLRYW